MYTIIEQQTAADGSVAIPPIITREDKNEAYSEYYGVLRYAAISSVPLHSVTILESTGGEIEHKCFVHQTEEG